jgi:hypothetical protein
MRPLFILETQKDNNNGRASQVVCRRPAPPLYRFGFLAR